ncbi:LamG domain-containing protein [Bdellovibrio svalbardensis]|uniref:LamG domain-containing protein n=1 Tax=Bdellovibrio svalbardensis TaxID=2972972 RepID=A0ABT6DFZ2_9BACT|nr:LamG domain-containing protein [Bdellovibrio svalbardensis]MDG0815770.1 LamG domain-containing protein [Bdellovibrio svalbardensis]
MNILSQRVLKNLIAFLFVGASSAQAQNLFFRGLLTADAQECRSLYNPQTPGYNTNLVAHWKMDGAAGVITNGATLSSGFTGGPTATATISSNSLSYTASGIINQGITANGTSADYISAGTPAALANLSAATWMMWIKVTAGSAIKLFYKSDNNSSNGYFLLIDSDRKLKFAKVHNGSNLQNFSSPLASAYFSNSWHQIVVTWNGTSTGTGAKLYMDGKELVYDVADPRFDTSSGNGSYVQNGTSGFASDATSPFILLGSPASTTTNPAAGAFSGTMDEFAVWNRVLNSTEIEKLYRHQKCN